MDVGTTPGGAALERRVIEILAAQALRDPDMISRADRVDALGLDSLGMAEVIFALEEGFDIAVPFDGVEPAAQGVDLSTVGGVVDAVAMLVAQPAR